jgi:hypothetical protein
MSALTTSMALPGGHQVMFTLSTDGYNTTLGIQSAGSGSTSSVSTGAWTAQPIVVSDGHSRAAILIEGASGCAVFAASMGGGGTQVASVGMDRAAFDQQYGAHAGFAALPWAQPLQQQQPVLAALPAAPAAWHDAAAVARLCEMGFEAAAVNQALVQAAGDESAAAEILLGVR